MDSIWFRHLASKLVAKFVRKVHVLLDYHGSERNRRELSPKDNMQDNQSREFNWKNREVPEWHVFRRHQASHHMKSSEHHWKQFQSHRIQLGQNRRWQAIWCCGRGRRGRGRLRWQHRRPPEKKILAKRNRCWFEKLIRRLSEWLAPPSIWRWVYHRQCNGSPFGSPFVTTSKSKSL